MQIIMIRILTFLLRGLGFRFTWSVSSQEMIRMPPWAVVLLVTLLAAWGPLTGVTGQSSDYEPLGCRDRQMCCAGRDSSCVVSEFHPNSIIEDLDSNRTIRCYCDESCLTLGDCCHDLRSYCGVSDCIVSNWGNWTECSSSCGVGKMSRRRQVLQESTNGGRTCPALLQSRACFNTDCAKRHEMREVAAVLPVIFGAARTTNDSTDIRHNLLLRYPKDADEERSREYCAFFQITKASKRCGLEIWSSVFKDGARVCVDCQKSAMRKSLGYRCKGQGLLNTETRWSAMLVNGCHGKWLMTSKETDCECPQKDKNSLIFV